MSRGQSLLARRLGWLLLFAGLVILIGCGRGPRRHHISGRITLDGKPVPVGEIYFDPDVTKGHDGPQGFARIKDGQFDTRQGGVPASAGPHVVRIQGFDGKSRPEAELPEGRRLFPEYQTTASIPDEGDATLDFQVPAQGKRP